MIGAARLSARELDHRRHGDEQKPAARGQQPENRRALPQTRRAPRPSPRPYRPRRSERAARKAECRSARCATSTGLIPEKMRPHHSGAGPAKRVATRPPYAPLTHWPAGRERTPRRSRLPALDAALDRQGGKLVIDRPGKPRLQPAAHRPRRACSCLAPRPRNPIGCSGPADDRLVYVAAKNQALRLAAALAPHLHRHERQILDLDRAPSRPASRDNSGRRPPAAAPRRTA